MEIVPLVTIIRVLTMAIVPLITSFLQWKLCPSLQGSYSSNYTLVFRALAVAVFKVSARYTFIGVNPGGWESRPPDFGVTES